MSASMTSSRNWYLESPVDCRSGLPSSQWGGIAGVNPPDFGATQSITDVLTDFACRFQVSPVGSPCTLDSNGNSNLLSPSGNSTYRQFCHAVSGIDAFPLGDTILTLQLRDTSQNLGPSQQIVVRVVP